MKELLSAAVQIILGLVSAVALIVGAAAFISFPAMIVVGILHGYHPDVPAIGLWNTWAWLTLVGIVGSRFNRSSSAS